MTKQAIRLKPQATLVVEKRSREQRRMLDLIRTARGRMDSLNLVLGWHHLTDEMRHELNMLKNEVGFILEGENNGKGT
jgi:hypothetical protein